MKNNLFNNNLFNKNVPISFNKEKQFTRNQNEGVQCMLINFLFATEGFFFRNSLCELLLSA